MQNNNKRYIKVSKIITFAIKKGGVGKSTSTITASLMLSEEEKVLIIDCDSQNALSSFFFNDINVIKNRTILEVIKGEIDIKESIFKITDNLHVIPATKDFSDINSWSRSGKELILRRLLKSIKQDYDYILIDTGPYDNTETTLGLSAGETIIIPVKLEDMDIRAIGFTLDKINNEIIPYLNQDIEKIHILPTQRNYQNRTVHELNLEDLKVKYPDMILDFEIPYSANISQLHKLKMEGLYLLKELKEYQKLVEVIR